MNEEIMTTTTEEIMEEVTELTEVYDEMPAEISEGSGNGMILKLVGVALAAAATAVVVKNKNKIKEWHTNRQIKKLEKKGFIVEYPVEVTDDFDDFEVDCDDDGSGNIIEIKGEEA
jgi:hypothetical protein